MLTHPTGHLEPYYVAALIGGALLFIGGSALFKRMTGGQNFFPLSHVSGLIMFTLLGMWSYLAHPAPLTLHLAATGLFLAIAVWEWGSFHGGWLERWARLRARKS